MKNSYPHVLKELLGKKSRPISLIHFITNRCNARCPHCFIDFDNKEEQSQQMSLEDVHKLTQSIGPQLMNVNITGGEPFYTKDLISICESYVKNTNISSIFFSTHGGPTKKIVDFLNFIEKHPHITFIFSISIDHIGEKHDHYRKVKSLFENALNTYRILKDYGRNVKVMVSITVSDFNALEIDEIFHTLTKKHNVSAITANLVREEGVYTIPKKKKHTILKGYTKLIKLIDELNLNQNQQEVFLKTKMYNQLMSEKDRIMYQAIQESFLEPKYHLPCYAGGGLMGVIYPNGDVFPCEVLDKKMGNLHDFNMDLEALWANNQELRNWIKESKCNCTYECAWTYNILASNKGKVALGLKLIKSLVK